jgi:integrase
MALSKRGKFWWYNFRFQKQRYCRSTRTTNRKAAETILGKLRVRLAEEGAGIRQPKRARFEDLAELMRADLQANGRKSIKGFVGVTKHLKARFAGSLARTITPMDIKNHVRDRLADGAAAATVNRELSALKRMFRLGMQAELVDSMPSISMLKEAKPRQGFFDAASFGQVLAFLPDHLRPVCEFAYLTGWRRSEITKLRWDQVDMRERGIRLWAGETKNQEGRFLPLEGELWHLIQRQRQTVGCQYVFNHFGRRIKTFYKAWERACRQAGCPGALFHDFRRTASRNLRRKGLSESEAMLITGHRTASVFRRYSITTEQDLRQAVADKGVFSADQAEVATKVTTSGTQA